MCACEPDFTCARCAEVEHDDDEPTPEERERAADLIAYVVWKEGLRA